MLARLLKSESLRSAVGFGAGGAGFAIGNILLARYLSTESFGIVTLALALNQFGVTFGPWGLEVVAIRHRPRIGRHLVRIVAATAIPAAIGIALIGYAFYDLSLPVTCLVLAMCAASAGNRVGVALFQGGQRLRVAMILSQAPNYTLMFAALLAMALAMHSDTFVVGFMTLSYLTAAVIGWLLAHRTLNEGRGELAAAVAFREGAAALGAGIAVEILVQFERLAIPKVGSLQMLGTYAVLAAVAGSPFRMLQIGTSFSLLPRLRAAASVDVAREVLRREFMTSFLVAIAAAVGIALVAPLVFHLVLGDKYVIPFSFVIATILVGLAKLWQSFSVTVVSACGSVRALTVVSVFAWMCLGVAAVGTVIGARYGLLGILYGVGAAWAILAVGSTHLALRSFRARYAAARHPT